MATGIGIGPRIPDVSGRKGPYAVSHLAPSGSDLTGLAGLKCDEPARPTASCVVSTVPPPDRGWLNRSPSPGPAQPVAQTRGRASTPRRAAIQASVASWSVPPSWVTA